MLVEGSGTAESLLKTFRTLLARTKQGPTQALNDSGRTPKKNRQDFGFPITIFFLGVLLRIVLIISYLSAFSKFEGEY